MAALLTVKHNIEVAHRLSLTPGKCENIHGHSMVVELSISGVLSAMGILYPNPGSAVCDQTPLEFGALKTWFRGMLDDHLDHHLLLNSEDPIAQIGWSVAGLPGLALLRGDPTTENIAKWVYEAAYREYIQFELRPEQGRSMLSVTVHETAVNSATYEDSPWALMIK